MNEKIKLESKAMLEMTLLDFDPAMELLSVVSEELLKVNIDLGNINLGDLAGSDAGNDVINTLKNVVLTLVTSKKLRDVLFECFGRCTYNGVKIDTNTFQDIKVRPDYFIVCWEVLKFNLLPFMPRIGSLFSKISGITGPIQKQK